MFFHDGQLQYEVTVDTPDPAFAKPHSGAQTEQMDESKLSEAIDKAKESFS